MGILKRTLSIKYAFFNNNDCRCKREGDKVITNLCVFMCEYVFVFLKWKLTGKRKPQEY